MRFLILLCLLSPVAHAQVCRMTTQPETTLAATHSRMELPDNQWLLFIGVHSIPSAVRNHVVLLLAEPDPDTNDLNEMQEMVVSNAAILEEYRQTKLFLQQFLVRSRPGFVAVEGLSNSYKQKESLALVYSPLTQSQNPPSPKMAALKPIRDQLLLLTIEPAFFLKIQEPDLFHGIEFFGLDMSRAYMASNPTLATPVQTPEPVQTDTTADALKAKTAEVRRKLRQNPKTLAEFNKIVDDFDLKSSALRGKSDAKIKEQTMRRVYEPAQPLIGEWVDAKLADLRKPKQEPKPAPAVQPSLADIEDEIALILFELHSSGILFVQEELFISAIQALADACKRQFVP